QQQRYAYGRHVQIDQLCAVSAVTGSRRLTIQIGGSAGILCGPAHHPAYCHSVVATPGTARTGLAAVWPGRGTGLQGLDQAAVDDEVSAGDVRGAVASQE